MILRCLGERSFGNRMKSYAFGVDLGGTTVKLGLFHTDGSLIDKWEIPTRTEDEGKNILPDIAATLQAKMQEKSLTTEDLEGIGIGVPGPVAPDGTVIHCVNLGWGVFNVEQVLSDLMMGLRVRAGNDANVAALGEMWQGGGRGYKNMVMVTLGTGVGGGIILDEHIVAGVNGAAGEIGHIQMKEDEPDICGCGRHGCLEQYASATGIVRITRRYLKEHPDADTCLRGEISARKIYDAAKEKDPVALLMMDEVTSMLGRALAGIGAVVNPEVFVIGGGVSRAGSFLLDAIEAKYEKAAFHAVKQTPFRLAELGNDAGIYGGVRLVL